MIYTTPISMEKCATHLRDDEGAHGGEEELVLGAVLVDRDGAEHPLPQRVVPVVNLYCL